MEQKPDSPAISLLYYKAADGPLNLHASKAGIAPTAVGHQASAVKRLADRLGFDLNLEEVAAQGRARQKAGPEAVVGRAEGRGALGADQLGSRCRGLARLDGKAVAVAQPDVRHAFIGESARVTGGADQHVAETVAVDVTRRRKRESGIGVGLVAFNPE